MYDSERQKCLSRFAAGDSRAVSNEILDPRQRESRPHVAVAALDRRVPAVVNRGLDLRDKVDDSAGKTVERTLAARLNDETCADALKVTELVASGLGRWPG
jgi:hypothetical protein